MAPPTDDRHRAGRWHAETLAASERVRARWEEKPADERAYIESLVPAGRLATPEEPAAAICFLCSDDATYMSGVVLDVNGGLFIG